MPLRQLRCYFRVPTATRIVIYPAAIDTGAPVTVFPHDFWATRCGWRAGRDFDELPVLGTGLTTRVLQHRFACRLVRMRRTLDVYGRHLTGNVLHLDSMVALLADPAPLDYILFGLSSLEGKAVRLDPRPDADDLIAFLDY